jgi:ADP-ribose pyrophosphatase YjhB (NUDIX family)
MTDRIKTAALWTFGRLPPSVKVRLVRLGSPSFTVGAMVCIERNGSILLTRSPHKRGWSLPGGLLKRGELPADGARREIFEELGVSAALEEPPAFVLDVVAQRCDVVFRARLADGDEPAPASYEIEVCRWFALEQLPVLHSHSTRALEAVQILKR